MSSTMAKKKKDDRHLGVRQAYYFPAELVDALNQYVEKTVPRPTKTSAVIAILQKFLAEEGLWPPGKE